MLLNFFKNLSGSTKLMGRNFFRLLGLEVRFNDLKSRDDLRLIHFLNANNIATVIDVGANKGQFALSLLEKGYKGMIVSFEPLPKAHSHITKLANKYNGRWTIAPRLALSDKAGEATFNVTISDAASSLFVPNKGLTDVTPQTNVAKVIQVTTARLDDIYKTLNLSYENIFLKLDVQGAESLVLSGAPEILSKCKGVITELSLTPLYEGQPTARHVIDLLLSAGFELWDIFIGYRNPISLRLSQIDILCFKP